MTQSPAPLRSCARPGFPNVLLATVATVSAKRLRELIAQARRRTPACPYWSTTLALHDLIAGWIDLLLTDLTALRYVKEKKLRSLAIRHSKRSPFGPDIPTMADAGVSDAELTFTLSVALPGKTLLALANSSGHC